LFDLLPAARLPSLEFITTEDSILHSSSSSLLARERICAGKCEPLPHLLASEQLKPSAGIADFPPFAVVHTLRGICRNLNQQSLLESVNTRRSN
jgi:hypothetical protein